MIVRALVEEWPDEVSVYVHELPGVIATADTLAGALDLLPDATEAHLSWLASHGFDVRTYDGLEIEVAEQLAADDGGIGPLFELDRDPATRERVEQVLQIAALARRDLVDLYRSVSEHRRDRTPSTDEWSIAEHLRHVAEAEAWYADSLVDGEIGGLLHDPLDAMRAGAAHADGILRGLDDDDRARVVERAGARWTPTKVMRRMAGHLREHYPWVQELASS